jgi:hypothetical protein
MNNLEDRSKNNMCNLGSYSNLQQYNDDQCLPACMTRWQEGRSIKDQMEYAKFVLNKPIPTPPVLQPNPFRKNTSCS